MSDALTIAPLLDADDAVDGAVSDHAKAIAEADDASRRIGEVPWWRRRAARAEHAALVRLAERLADHVRAINGWARFVDSLVIDEWRTMQRALSTRHAFHPSLASSVPAHRASIAQRVGAKHATLLPEVAHGIAPTDAVRVEAVPQPARTVHGGPGRGSPDRRVPSRGSSARGDTPDPLDRPSTTGSLLNTR
ncbi:hypothetical protein [Demequina litorisediminis]|uniref:DUF222 domain-containing protein n=1 Tax=Demequina litorisediminis TaxID=1849022 RepID=A0ABQ6IGG1_9MICO|nr:hypothetical protein [Demequina litorisediminis]GMA35823.1 hypothetical protein GCM10025876_20270 [Demequina litorisediminis]